MTPAEPVPPEAAEEERPPHLTWRSFLLCMAILIAIFVGLNPVWEPIDMDEMEANIIWSYIPIPLLVVIFLRLERNLRWASFAFETLRMTLVKFAVTYLAANLMWYFVGPPPAPEPAAVETVSSGAAVGLYQPQDAPAPTTMGAAAKGGLGGRLVDGDGQPVPGALVWISSGLQHVVFPTPTDTVKLTHDGAGFASGAAGGSADAPTRIQTFQPVVLTNASPDLHTARATDATGRRLFHYPVLPDAEREVMFDTGLGLVTLGCHTHPDEPSARLLVTGSPFAAVTDADGRFAFEGVPVGELVVTGWRPDRPEDDDTKSAKVELLPDGYTTLTLIFR